MQRFINNPDEVVEDTVKGFVKAHSDIVRLAENPRVVVAQAPPSPARSASSPAAVPVMSPAFIGYTGRNMLDAVAVGELFSSPTAKSFHDAMREANGGKGVVCLYGNYAGDNMNVKMAIKLAAKDGIEVATVVANDDVCSAPPEEREKRRGVAGEIFMWKVGGAKACEGASLEEVRATAQKAIDNCRSIGVGLGPAPLPAVGHPNFQIEPGTMEVGIGHHGEPASGRALKTADAVAKDMCKIVLDDHDLASGTEVAVLVSGLGATPLNELYILYDTIEQEVAARGLKIHKTYIGNYFTSLEMVGATLTVMALDDDLKRSRCRGALHHHTLTGMTPCRHFQMRAAAHRPVDGRPDHREPRLSQRNRRQDRRRRPWRQHGQGFQHGRRAAEGRGRITGRRARYARHATDDRNRRVDGTALRRHVYEFAEKIEGSETIDAKLYQPRCCTPGLRVSSRSAKPRLATRR
jgi:dihydroxyacetone kinase-like protein